MLLLLPYIGNSSAKVRKYLIRSPPPMLIHDNHAEKPKELTCSRPASSPPDLRPLHTEDRSYRTEEAKALLLLCGKKAFYLQKKRAYSTPRNQQAQAPQKETHGRSPIKPTVGRIDDLPWVVKATY
ncbi:hypothetical protein, partial [uncultured Porphyromonas sp.]|uniref:hypothetical protein n=1 Tax=uncultured Porphyromonas sp. TaxID=159274 RepID=UPI002617329C